MNRHSRQTLHAYWQDPDDGTNLPIEYLLDDERSELVVRLLSTYADNDARVLELGCNIGRNLVYLHDAGWSNLWGVDISEQALAMMDEVFGDAAHVIHTSADSLEDWLPQQADASFDVIFTMAVLEHIHYESEWIFEEIERICGTTLIVVEDEGHVSLRHFPRNYRQVFEPLGLRQVDSFGCEGIAGLNSHFVVRVFQKP